MENYVYWTLSIALKDFPGGSDGKASAYSAGDPGSIPGSGRSPGEGNGNPLQYSWTSLVAQMVKRLPIMRETWVWSLGREDLLEKEIAIHSSTLAWKIPWMEEPGKLQSMGSQRVGHDWATSMSCHVMYIYIICICICTSILKHEMNSFIKQLTVKKVLAVIIYF